MFRKKALVYEQFNLLIKIYSDKLQECGYEVFATKEFDEAYKYFLDNDIDILWVKYESVSGGADKRSGYELLQKLFNEEKYSNVFKIVTGSFVKINKGDVIKLLKLKVDEQITVPTSGGFLKEVIQRADKKTHPDSKEDC